MTQTAVQPIPREKTQPQAILLRALLTMAVPILLTLTSVRVVMTPMFVNLAYNFPGFPEDTYGFSREDRLNYAPYALHYLISGEDIGYLGNLRLPKELCIVASRGAADCAMYNAEELRHMRDVKVVTQYAYLLAVVLGISAVVGGYLLWRKITSRSVLYLSLMNGGILTISLIAAIVIGAVVSWDFFFNTFHSVFFESGTWRFAYSDTLIRLFPEQFWFDAALAIGGMTLLGAAAISFFSWRKLRNF